MDKSFRKLLVRVSRLFRAADDLERKIESLAVRDIAAASRCALLLEELRKLLSQIGDALLDGTLSDEQIDAQLKELDGGLALLGINLHGEDDDDQNDDHDDERMGEEEAREVGAFLERELRPKLIGVLHLRGQRMSPRQFTACVNGLCSLEQVMERLQSGDAPDSEQALDNFLDNLVGAFASEENAQ
jgi:hypothetical protein